MKQIMYDSLWSCENEEAFKHTLMQKCYIHEFQVRRVASDNSSFGSVVESLSSLLFEHTYQHLDKIVFLESKT